MGDDAPDESPDELDYFSSLDAPRWVVLLAACGLAVAGVAVARAAVRLIASALGG